MLESGCRTGCSESGQSKQGAGEVAAGAVTNKPGENIVYINVMTKLSINCECDGNPAPPEMDEIGMFASTDPVALDRACVDLVYAAEKKRGPLGGSVELTLLSPLQGGDGTSVSSVVAFFGED